MVQSHGKTFTNADGTDAGVVRPSEWNTGHNHYITLTGNTIAGSNSTLSGTNIFFGASGIGSIGFSSGSLILSPAASVTGSVYHVIPVMLGCPVLTSLPVLFPGIASGLTFREFYAPQPFFPSALFNNYLHVAMSVSVATAANTNRAIFKTQAQWGLFQFSGASLNRVYFENLGNGFETWSSSNTNSVAGPKLFEDIQNMNADNPFPAGRYAMGMFFQFFSTSTQTSINTTLGHTVTLYGENLVALSVNMCAPFGVSTSAGAPFVYAGYYSTSSGGLPSVIALSDLIFTNSTAGHAFGFFRMAVSSYG
jgi:hypothetical protein